VNFFTMTSSTTLMQYASEATEFGEITQNKGHYAIQARSFRVTDFGTNLKLICDFLLVINTNLPPILHRFQDIAFDRSKIAIFGYPLAFKPPRWRGSGGTICVKFSVDVNGWPRYQMASKHCEKFPPAE